MSPRLPLLASLLLLTAACDKNGDNDGPKPEPVSTANPGPAPGGDDGDKPEPAPEPPPSAEPIKCGDKTCTPPEECITVVGSIESAPAREECWITCGDDKPCPAGMECTMIHDGPGQVCQEAS